jgi:hypothetical protein
MVERNAHHTHLCRRASPGRTSGLPRRWCNPDSDTSSNPCSCAAHADGCTGTDASCLPRSNTGSYPSCNTSADAHIYANRLSCSYASNHSQPRTHPSGDTDTVGAVYRETRHSIRSDRRAFVTSASSAVFYWNDKGYV